MTSANADQRAKLGERSDPMQTSFGMIEIYIHAAEQSSSYLGYSSYYIKTQLQAVLTLE